MEERIRNVVKGLSADRVQNVVDILLHILEWKSGKISQLNCMEKVCRYSNADIIISAKVIQAVKEGC